MQTYSPARQAARGRRFGEQRYALHFGVAGLVRAREFVSVHEIPEVSRLLLLNN